MNLNFNSTYHDIILVPMILPLLVFFLLFLTLQLIKNVISLNGTDCNLLYKHTETLCRKFVIPQCHWKHLKLNQRAHKCSGKCMSNITTYNHILKIKGTDITFNFGQWDIKAAKTIVKVMSVISYISVITVSKIFSFLPLNC